MFHLFQHQDQILFRYLLELEPLEYGNYSVWQNQKHHQLFSLIKLTQSEGKEVVHMGLMIKGTIH